MENREWNKQSLSHNALVSTTIDTTQVRESALCRPDVYHLHVELNWDYEPLCKHNKHNTISKPLKNSYKFQGHKNIDLWVDGKLYPIDSLHKSTPPFRDVTSLLQFVGDGYHGLLGYTLSLEAQHRAIKLEHDFMERENINLKHIVAQYAQKSCTTNETIMELQRKINALRTKHTNLGYRKWEKKIQPIGRLKLGAGGIKKWVHAIR